MPVEIETGQSPFFTDLSRLPPFGFEQADLVLLAGFLYRLLFAHQVLKTRVIGHPLPVILQRDLDYLFANTANTVVSGPDRSPGQRIFEGSLPQIISIDRGGKHDIRHDSPMLGAFPVYPEKLGNSKFELTKIAVLLPGESI